MTTRAPVVLMIQCKNSFHSPCSHMEAYQTQSAKWNNWPGKKVLFWLKKITSAFIDFMYCPWIEPNHWNVIVQVKHDCLRFTNQYYESEDKMVNELSSVIEMFQSFKKSCRSATLTMSTWRSKSTKVKLEVELDYATQSSASPSPTSSLTAPSLRLTAK